MGWILLILLAAIAALYDHGPLSLWPVAPSAVCALTAWIGVNGSDRDLLPRVWLVGLVADAIDPGSTVFHSLMLLTCTLLFMPLRQFLFRRSALAWALWACALPPLMQMGDLLTGGHPPLGGWAGSVSTGVLTAVLVLPAGFLLNVLPPRLHPLGDVNR